jgi:LysR family glycine cleavage system transcriptional activator
MRGKVPARQNWESLRVFVTCAQQLSFTRAASELGLTQAAISQRIKQLEDRLQMQLFVRSPRLALTQGGARLAPALAQAFMSIDRALASAAACRPLSVTATLTMAVMWLIPRLGEFRRRHPDIEVALDVTDELRVLDDQHFDVAIRTLSTRPSDAESALLFPNLLTPMLSPQLLTSLDPITPQTLTRLPLLPDVAWSAWFRAAGVVPPPRIRPIGIALRSQHLAAEAVLKSEGVALLSPRFFRAHLQSGRLVQPFNRTVSANNYYAAWHTELAREPAVDAFRRWLLAETRSESKALVAQRAGAALL